jgi:hypothetical protein
MVAGFFVAPVMAFPIQSPQPLVEIDNLHDLPMVSL